MRRTAFATNLVLVTAVLVVLVAIPLPAMGLPGATGNRPLTGGGVPSGSARLGARPLERPETAGSLACLALPRASPCLPGADSPVADLVANASDSGAWFSVGIQLPGAGTDPASVLGSFWVGLWVTGVPCSIDGASYLAVTLYPPYSPSVVPASPDWVAQVPVRDLVPSGSCDPLCQNASATGVVSGVPTCEDNIVLGGGWPSSDSVGRFAPGDQLLVTARGIVGGSSPLTTWVNDSTNPAESARWQFGAATTVTGVPVDPRYLESNASDPGWATPYDVAFGWTDCPSASGATACNTYDRNSLASVGVPLVTSASYWNASSSAEESFPWIATASTSGACSGSAALAACPDAQSFGGTGGYPTLAIVPDGATGSAWRIGSGDGTLAGYGGVAGQFLPNGSATWQSPAAVSVTSATGRAGVVSANLTVADPRGATAVEVGALWCSPSGPVFTQVVTPASGTLANVTASLDVASENGTLTYWVSERSAGVSWGASVGHTLAMTGGTASCAIPSPAAPGFGPANATTVAGGYHLNWTESSTDIRGYVVDINATASGFAEALPVGNVTATTVTGLAAGVSYRITVTAETFANTTNATVVTPSASPLAPLTVVTSLPTGTLWHGSSLIGVNVTATGGAAPFQFEITLGNGSTVTALSSNNSSVVPVDFLGGVGFGTVQTTVTDAQGVVAVGAPLLRDVWSGPLAPVANSSAGALLVGVNWSASLSPSAPVTRYVAYLTEVPALAATSYLVGTGNTTANITDGGVQVWNTTGNSVVVPWPNNVTAFASVVPYDALGSGFATTVPVAATPAPLAPGTIEGGPGGPEPFTTTFSTAISTGTDDPIVEGIYSFPGFSFEPANVTRTSPTEVFVNASARLTTLGLVQVLLHVSDAYGGTAIVATDVLVSPGAAPLVSVAVNPSPAYVGVVVNFTATATGTGPFAYTWQFGDGTNGSGATADHTYGVAGTFTATVTVVDNGTGGSNVTSVPVTVYALPSVVIVADAGTNGSGSFAFHARLLGGVGPGSFVWAFGDGVLGHGENVTHTYTSAGTYLVNVTATDASLRSSYANVTVDVGPVATSSTGGSAFGTFTPLVAGLLVAAVVGWGVAILALVRLRTPPERDPGPDSADDEDKFVV
jgi:PKD repeat protein